jgi:hypothetical protein
MIIRFDEKTQCLDQTRDENFKGLVNEALRRGLRQMAAAQGTVEDDGRG